MELLATILAAIAMSTAGDVPKSFERGYTEDSHWVASEYFIGVEWPCRGKYRGETCFAGIEVGFDDANGFVTGP